jgi:hypothetical protein
VVNTPPSPQRHPDAGGAADARQHDGVRPDGGGDPLCHRYVPTQEVAFFRNAFGLLALLPMLLRPAVRR